MDDIIVTGSNATLLANLLTDLQVRFDMKNLGTLNYFLGIHAMLDRKGLFLNQTKYSLSLLRKCHMDGCKPISSPIAPGSKLSLFDGDLLPDATEYRRIVGGLQYLTFTRPDLTYAVNQVCQFMHAPRTSHFNAVKRILRYLKGTLDYGIHITKNYSFDISCYSDADWAGCPDDRRSTSGYAIYIGSNLVSWSAKKQKTVSRSSTEAEYRGIANAAAEIQWLQYLLSDLEISSNNSPVLYCDNISADLFNC